jgi:hypothetical protein
MPNDYQHARNARKQEAPLPESDKHTLTPNYLLSHQNHFDPNVYTPEDMIKKGILKPGGIPTEGKA